jgi:hypothetical protein
MAISASELQQLLVSDFTDGEERHYPPYWFWNELADCDPIELEGVGKVESVTVEGGEGQGDSLHMVLKLTHPDYHDLGLPAPRYFRADGYYSSYDGRDWDGAELYEVEPREKTITVYEAI